MFDSDRPDAYEAVYRELVRRLGEADLARAAAALGLAFDAGRATVPLLGASYLVSGEGVRAEGGGAVPVAHRVVLAHYLLHGGAGEPAGRFVPYRELPGGMDFARNLAVTVEGRLARTFAGRARELARTAEALGGRPTDPGTGCDVAFEVVALPKIPMMVTFYDADEDFPAEAKVFYDALAPGFLDLECLAVLGMILVEELERLVR